MFELIEIKIFSSVKIVLKAHSKVGFNGDKHKKN